MHLVGLLGVSVLMTVASHHILQRMLVSVASGHGQESRSGWPWSWEQAKQGWSMDVGQVWA